MKLQKTVKTTISSILLVSIAGCATMFHGTSQQVSIRSNDENAKLYVNEEYIGKGNGVTVFKKNKNYTIVARKEGCQDAVKIPSKSFDATTLLGILIDYGIISILIVDGLANGAWTQFDQTNFVLDPNCSGDKTVSVNSVPGSMQKEDKKEAEVIKTAPVQPATNFNGGTINKK